MEEAFKLLKENMTDDHSYKLANMKYRNFLRTKYWEIVRKYMYYLADYLCEACFISGTLIAHHKSYENRGYEYKHLDDLMVLCPHCHMIQHKIEREIK